MPFFRARNRETDASAVAAGVVRSPVVFCAHDSPLIKEYARHQERQRRRSGGFCARNLQLPELRCRLFRPTVLFFNGHESPKNFGNRCKVPGALYDGILLSMLIKGAGSNDTGL